MSKYGNRGEEGYAKGGFIEQYSSCFAVVIFVTVNMSEKILNNFWRKENKKQSEFEIFLDDKSLNKKKIANKLPKANQWLGMEVEIQKIMFGNKPSTNNK